MLQPSESPAATGRSTLEAHRRFHELDGLRAVAVALVVFHHSLTSPVTQVLDSVHMSRAATLLSFATRSGVELFFVLSGVVLLRPYLRRIRPFQISTYLLRRVQRLWPPYAVALLFAGAVVALPAIHPTWYSAEVLPRLSAAGWAAQLLIVNLGWQSYSGAWWSLSLEVAFYLLAPLIVLCLVGKRVRPRAFGGLAVVSIVASLAVAVWVSPEARFGTPNGSDLNAGRATAVDAAAAGRLLLLYAPCFMMGTLLAAFTLTLRTGRRLIYAGLVYCLVALFYPKLNIHLGFASLYGGIVILAMGGSIGWLRLGLSHRWVLWLGERSYSLFLVHFSVFYLVNYFASLAFSGRNVTYFILTRVVQLPLALVVAMVLFWFVERHFARGLATADQFWPWRWQ